MKKEAEKIEGVDKLKQLQEELAKEAEERQRKCSEEVNEILTKYNCDIQVEMVCVENKGIAFRKSIITK